MTSEEIRQKLFSMQDPVYRDFQKSLVPNMDSIIGVRVPLLRKFAKQLKKEGDYTAFLRDLPHAFYDENTLHAFLLEGMDYEDFLREINLFLPYIDNWATCDGCRPKVVKKHLGEFLPQIRLWLQSSHTYTIRFGMNMLLAYYLEDAFTPEILELAANVHSEEYYVMMMQAWFFATALAKQWDSTIPYLLEHSLSPWVHNKTIQKSIESYRITSEQKLYLRGLKISRR